jgi:multidrug efflux system outer membrane protein
MKRMIIILILGISGFILNSCSFYAKPTDVSIEYPTSFKEKLENTNASIDVQHWWKSFNDETLNYYVDLALKNNPNYLIALKNIELSKAYVLENSSALFPNFNLNGSETRQKVSQRTPNGRFFSTTPYTTYNLSVSASYEIDLFAKALNAYKYYKENVKITEAQAKAIKNALIMNTVNNYFQIIENGLYIDILEEQLRIAKENLEILETKYKAGVVSYQNIDQAKISIQSLEQTLQSYKNQRSILINAFAYLLGKYPEEFKFSASGDIPKEIKLPEAIPSTVMTERPDIQEAISNVIANDYEKKIALANFFPSFNLTGSYGFQSKQLSNLITQPSVAWNFGLNIIEPILNWNKNIGIYKASEIALAKSIINYRQIVLNAFREVDDAISQYKTDKLNYKNLETIYQNTYDQYEIALANYKAGITPYSTLLNYKTNLLDAKKNLLNQRLILIQDVTALYNVLGY